MSGKVNSWKVNNDKNNKINIYFKKIIGKINKYNKDKNIKI